MSTTIAIANQKGGVGKTTLTFNIAKGLAARGSKILVVDNDPASHGPNCLVHVIPEADYGHRWLYGLGGNHPLNGWGGTLPGTLPPISAVGKAPAGLRRVSESMTSRAV